MEISWQSHALVLSGWRRSPHRCSSTARTSSTSTSRTTSWRHSLPRYGGWSTSRHSYLTTIASLTSSSGVCTLRRCLYLNWCVCYCVFSWSCHFRQIAQSSWSNGSRELFFNTWHHVILNWFYINKSWCNYRCKGYVTWIHTKYFMYDSILEQNCAGLYFN